MPVRLDILNEAGGLGQWVGSDAGSLSIMARESVLLDGGMAAQGGGISNRGGVFNLVLGDNSTPSPDLGFPTDERLLSLAQTVAPQAGGLALEVSIGGRRYRVFVDAARGRTVQSLLTGERFEASGSVGALQGNWQWIASRHLSGRLRLRTIGRIDQGRWWWQSADAVRRTVDTGLSSFDSEERSLFEGVVFGDDRDQPVLTRHRFRASGLAHLLAVSGQNVAFVLVAVSPLLARLRLRTRWIVTIGLLLAFATVTRFEPSVLRATAMALVAATAAMSGRYATGVRVVSVAVLALLVIDPLLVWSGGFRLSVAASVALVTLARPIERRLRGPRWLVEPLAVSLAAQVGTAPLLVLAFGTVPLLSPLANLAAVPVAGWLMVWGVVTGPLAGLIGEPAATWIGWPSRLMIHWIDGVATLAARPELPSVGVVGVAAITALVAAILMSLDRVGWRRALASFGAVALLVELVILAPSGHLTPSRGVDIYVDASTRGSDAVVVVIGTGVDDLMLLDDVTRARIDHVDLVIVPRASRTNSTTVQLLRTAVDVRLVVAADPSLVRDAEPLTAGELRVGSLRFTVAVDRHSGSGATARGFTVGTPV